MLCRSPARRVAWGVAVVLLLALSVGAWWQLEVDDRSLGHSMDADLEWVLLRVEVQEVGGYDPREV